MRVLSIANDRLRSDCACRRALVVYMNKIIVNMVMGNVKNETCANSTKDVRCCSGISPRQKYRTVIERDQLLLGIPDRRPDVIS